MSDGGVALDHFGQFLTQHLRDGIIEHFDSLASSRWKTPGLAALQAELSGLSEQDLAVARRAVVSAADAAIHDFLFKLQEQADFDNRISVMVDGIDVIAVSDGIHGEPSGPEGWYARFSAFGGPNGSATSADAASDGPPHSA